MRAKTNRSRFYSNEIHENLEIADNLTISSRRAYLIVSTNGNDPLADRYTSPFVPIFRNSKRRAAVLPGRHAPDRCCRFSYNIVGELRTIILITIIILQREKKPNGGGGGGVSVVLTGEERVGTCVGSIAGDRVIPRNSREPFSERVNSS